MKQEKYKLIDNFFKYYNLEEGKGNKNLLLKFIDYRERSDKPFDEAILKNILKKLNRDNYSDLIIGLKSKVNVVERTLFKIEDAVFHNNIIQKVEWENFKKDNKEYI